MKHWIIIVMLLVANMHKVPTAVGNKLSCVQADKSTEQIKQVLEEIRKYS